MAVELDVCSGGSPGPLLSYFFMMSDNLISDDDERTRIALDEINSYEELVEQGSTHTVSLYEDVSDGGFSDDARYDQEVNVLEREYFDSIHTAEFGVNDTYSTSKFRVDGKTLSDFESKHFHQYNVTPNRPLTAFFKTESYVNAKEIFEALKSEGFAADHVRCLQRKPTGEIYITFKTQEIRDAFLKTRKFASPRAPNNFFVPQNAERPLTYLTIYDAPYELSDEAIIHRLAPYCEVIWHRRGKFAGTAGAVYNGLRHYRVCLDHAIPCYLRFGKFLVRLQYDGQNPTCRKCNRPDHKAVDCRNKICFNCDGLGHEARECIRPMYCCICKSGQHLARDCKFSWRRAARNQIPEQPRPTEGTGGNESDLAEGSPAAHAPGESPASTPGEIVEDMNEDLNEDVTPSAPEDATGREDDEQKSPAEENPPLTSPRLEESQLTPVPGASPAPEGDFTETLDSVADLSVSAVTQHTQDAPTPRIDENSFIVEERSNRAAAKTIPNTEMHATPESSASWADIVDRAPVVNSPTTQRGAKPQRGPRRRITPAPSLIPALTRKKTQPARVPTSKTAPQPRVNSGDSEVMDTSVGSRKRKNDVEDSEGGGKLSA